MSGIVGIAHPGNRALVNDMLGKIAHRGHSKRITETSSATLGYIWSHDYSVTSLHSRNPFNRWDYGVPENFVLIRGDELILKRDPLGVVPIYYGWTREGLLCFASEIKGLLVVTQDVHELPPGHTFDGEKLEAYFTLRKLPVLNNTSDEIAQELHRRLETVVEKQAQAGNVGAWLSGGLDSSVMASLARPYVKRFHTFAAGMPGSLDIEYARIVADFIHSEHHEVIVDLNELLAVLPEVIYHLESFDAWLVRSSMMNFLVARLAAEYVPSVFSGEGGDELFAGYEYLKVLDPTEMADELIDITSRLHNTALQRVDRCASAHGTVAHVGFLDPDVVEYALRIPIKFKLRNGVEKWILRQAMIGDLPNAVLTRPKAKFWQGAGVQEILAQYAEQQISDKDFNKERILANGWKLNTKEELLYYRIFREYFGELVDLTWMGRTKGSPIL